LIYTITLNPSLDYIMQVDEIRLGETNRAVAEHINAGGKGINVSIVLSNLDMPTTALGFFGGFTGKQLNEILVKFPQINNSLIEVAGTTRINVKLKGKIETEINGTGTVVDEFALQALDQQLQKITKQDFVVLAGSIGAGMPQDWYLLVTKYLHERQIPFVLDIPSKSIFDVLPFRPMLVKPNQAELESFFDVQCKTVDDIIVHGQKLLALGAEHVIISRGEKGSIFLFADEVYEAQVPKGTLIDSVGAGDSMVAGFLYGMSKFCDKIQAYRYACSCGSSTAFSSHLAEQELINKLYEEIEINKIGVVKNGN
jgi:1-phosphofructokinase